MWGGGGEEGLSCPPGAAEGRLPNLRDGSDTAHNTGASPHLTPKTAPSPDPVEQGHTYP